MVVIVAPQRIMCAMHKAGWLIYQRLSIWQAVNDHTTTFYSYLATTDGF